MSFGAKERSDCSVIEVLFFNRFAHTKPGFARGFRVLGGLGLESSIESSWTIGSIVLWFSDV